jgi:hypothetical protein
MSRRLHREHNGRDDLLSESDAEARTSCCRLAIILSMIDRHRRRLGKSGQRSADLQQRASRNPS